MRLIGLGVASPIVLSLTIACSQKESEDAPRVSTAPASVQSENYPTLAVQAQEISDAVARRDFAKLADLTYPKAIEAAGGRDRMVSTLTSEMKKMEAEGVVVLSSTAGTPTQVINVSGSIYAVLPTILKVKAKDGIFQTEGSMIGISSDNGTTWTFIDAGEKDQKDLKKLLPTVADKLSLPKEKLPVRISDGE